MNAAIETLKTEPLLAAKTAVEPAEFARLLRANGPAFFWAPDRFWVVTDHALAACALKSPDYSADRSPFFKDRPGCPFHKIGDFFGLIKKMMVMSDGAEHAARRRLAQAGIADRVLDAFRPTVERVVDGLVEKAAARDAVEFAGELAAPLPGTVLAELFCVPEERRAEFFRWADDMTQFFGGASRDVEKDAVRANASAVRLREYFRELVAERRREPREDFLTRLLEHQKALGLEDDELISQSVMMLVAGTVTASDQICNVMNGLLEQPGLIERLRESPELLDAAIEEATRLDPAVDFVFRVAKTETALGGARLKPGELLFVSIDSVNRDPKVFEDPEEFRLDRVPNPHMSYGHGSHFCLGARLARIEMNALFSALLRRFPRLAKAAPAVRKEQSLAFSGFASLTLSL